MQDGFPEAEVFEVKKIDYKSPIVFAGFVGAGLVGPLSVGYIIEKLGMEDDAFLAAQGVLNKDMAKIKNDAKENDSTVFHQFCEDEFNEYNSK